MYELMTIEEMKERYQNGEESLNLTIEKWERIQNFAGKITQIGHFRILLQAASVAVPFCFEYQKRNCLGCPLENICSPRKGEKFYHLMRVIQAYALAGDVLPKEILMSEIDKFITELKLLRLKF